METHDRDLASAFDAQAARFERSAVHAEPSTLARLVEFAALTPGSRVLDAGSGPGLVAEAFLAAGHRVTGVDLSPEMVRRARARCARFGELARFEEGSLFQLVAAEPFDAAVSRLVLHHLADPLAFLRRQVELVRPGGVVVASDHSGDADEVRARWHHEIEVGRDRTHVRNLSPGACLDLFVRAGLRDLRLAEEAFELDFDEWFDRGTPSEAKEAVRARLLAGRARAFEPSPRPDGSIAIRCLRALVRGVRP